MRTAVVSTNLDSPVEVNLKAATKAPTPADSSAPSFERALTHARKPAAASNSTTEKAKPGKAPKTKQSKTTEITTNQRGKVDKADSTESEETDAKDATADASDQDSSNADDKQAATTPQKAAGDETETTDPQAEPEDTATISDVAQTAAESDSGQETAPAVHTAETTGKVTAKNKNAANSSADNTTAGQTAVVTTAAVKAPTPTRQNKEKSDNSSTPSNANALASDGKDLAANAVTSIDITPALATPVQDSTVKGSKTESPSIAAAQVESSSDADPSDIDQQIATAQTTPPATATAQADTTGDSKAVPSAPAAAIGQSSFAAVVQTLAGPTSSALTNATGSVARATAGASNAGAKFVAENHSNIVQSVKTQLLPNGGTMRLRLDPPELGAMQVSVHVKDGVVTASFETSNDQATKMLSHSMGQLKQALESQGITVGKMHVQQSPKNESTGDRSTEDESDSSQSKENTSTSQQDEQRRETLRRMWERLSIGGDPLDMVA